MTTKEASLLQEKEIAKMVNGVVTKASGGTKFGGGDILTEHMLIEAKTTLSNKESFSIKNDWIKKAREQAFEQRKSRFALAFRFSTTADDYYIIDKQQFKEYVDLLNKEMRNVE